MEIEDVLKDIGLNHQQSQVYLATLELGSSTVLPISKKSGIKRTYCYDILESLMKQGMVSYIEKNGRRRYSAEDPKHIEDTLKTKLERFSEALPQLRSVYNKKEKKPVVRFYEGKDEVTTVYELIPKSRRVDVLGSPDHIYQCLGRRFDQIAAEVAKNKCVVRELVPDDAIGARYLEQLNKDQLVRIMPRQTGFATDLIILDNMVALISFEAEAMGVVIESDEVVSLQRYMFDFVWQMSEKVESS